MTATSTPITHTLRKLPPAKRRKVLGQLATRLVPRIRYVPVPLSQAQMAGLLMPKREVFYGGAAGGGKTYWLLAKALQYADVPGYSAVLIRETFAQLSKPGQMIPLARAWLTGKARWNGNDHQWTFPSGATLSFAYVKTDADAEALAQGPSYQFVGWDEVTSTSEERFRKITGTRLRKPKAHEDVTLAPAQSDGMTLADVPLRVAAASNPGGRGHTWVRTRWVDAETRVPDATFIPARLEDNPFIDAEDYEAQMLAQLSSLDYKRMREGDWDVLAEGSVWQRAWMHIVDGVLLGSAVKRVRAWDLAATEPSEENRDPDWTVGLLLAWDKALGDFRIEDVVRDRLSPGKVRKLVRDTAELDGRRIPIVLHQDPAQAGKDQVDSYKRDTLAGFTVHGWRETGDIETRVEPIASAFENGLVTIRRAAWNRDLIDELTAFPEGHDDQAAILASAHGWLTVGKSRATRKQGLNRPRGTISLR